MGMMGIQEPVQNMPTQSMQGMLSSIDGQNRPFNGDIDVGGKMIHVTNGVVDGSTAERKIFVSADGEVVFDNQGRIMGSLDENNVLQKPTQELIDKLQKMGLTQQIEQ